MIKTWIGQPMLRGQCWGKHVLTECVFQFCHNFSSSFMLIRIKFGHEGLSSFGFLKAEPENMEPRGGMYNSPGLRLELRAKHITTDVLI